MPWDLRGATHPRGSGLRPQLLVLLVAAALGLLLGAGLLAADRSSWRAATTASATVVGRTDAGVAADVGGRRVVLHLPQIPSTGTVLPVEVTPDGRARPLAYRATPGRALRSGVLFALGAAVVLQAYRFVVTRRPAG